MFGLALRLGIWDVDALAAAMPMALLVEWQAFAMLNPLLFDAAYAQARDDWNAGMVAAQLTNTLTALFAKRPTRLQADDLRYRQAAAAADTPRQSAKETYEAIKMHLILGGNLKRPEA